MIRKILMVLALLTPFATGAQAESHGNDSIFDHNDHDHNGGYCSQYYDPSQCAADRNCKFDWIERACVEAGIPGGGGGNRACSSYDRDPYLCNDQPNCEYDNQWNRCTDRFPGGGGGSCSRYDNDPFTCNNVPGCGFDTWSRRCVEDGQGPGPGPGGGQIYTTTINCSSSQYRYQRCPVYGQIVDAYLLNEESFASCQQGRSWGYDQQGLWVDQGCRANFQVRYRN